MACYIAYSPCPEDSVVVHCLVIYLVDNILYPLARQTEPKAF